MHYFELQELSALLTAAYMRNRIHHMVMLASVAHGLRVSDAINLTSKDVQGSSLVVNSPRRICTNHSCAR